tara:strand:- start:41 stop:199 length:159 start_codon:yes stop_codon:yes gene_type:complete
MIQEELFLKQVIAEQAQHAFVMDMMFWVGTPILMMIGLQILINCWEAKHEEV